MHWRSSWAIKMGWREYYSSRTIKQDSHCWIYIILDISIYNIFFKEAWIVKIDNKCGTEEVRRSICVESRVCNTSICLDSFLKIAFLKYCSSKKSNYFVLSDRCHVKFWATLTIHILMRLTTKCMNADQKQREGVEGECLALSLLSIFSLFVILLNLFVKL